MAAALTPDELLLIANGNVPASVKTAEFYAKARLVPDGRILKLNLPGAEEISFDRYERDIVPQVRQFLRDNDLKTKVKCLVTFYGLPIRIGSKQMTAQEHDEVAQLKQQLETTLKLVAPSVDEAEQLARKLNPLFMPGYGTTHAALAARANAALLSINQHLPPANDPAHRELLPQLIRLMTVFGGDAQLVAKLDDQEAQQVLPADRAEKWSQRRDQIDEYQIQIRLLEDKLYDADARKKTREIVSDAYGLFGVAGLLEAQMDYLSSDGTVSALDNELALLWWNYYSHAKWQGNPLNFRYTGTHPQTLMVMRLDGPQEGTAEQIILGSLKAEKEGLKGRIVIDSNGGGAPGGAVDRDGGYRAFDKKLLNLAQIVENKTQNILTLDKHPSVLPANSVKDVALYCGWYSVRNYVPACQFNAGAVGYHVASFEMVSLHGDNEHGWVAGLLNDGVAATLGAVAEPYLSAFPAPDEFFPLLMTGKLSLAEVYWKTTPMTSWMMSCIGDPLYTPYKADPLLKPEDLDPALRRRFNRGSENAEIRMQNAERRRDRRFLPRSAFCILTSAVFPIIGPVQRSLKLFPSRTDNNCGRTHGRTRDLSKFALSKDSDA